MRIVAGKWRGKRLSTPADAAIRPTADRVRESLFNLLEHGKVGPGSIAGFKVLDVFAGSGALGLEALSRGAASVTFLEKDAAACRLIARNVAACGGGEVVDIRRGDAVHPGPAPRTHDLVLADPPYGEGLGAPALAALAAAGWIGAGACVVLEVGAKDGFEPPAGFAFLERRRYGAAALIFLGYGPDR